MNDNKLYIHIGIGKTGTSSIQDFCFNNRGELQNAGWLYPETGLHGTGHHALAELEVKKVSSTNKNNFSKIAQQLGIKSDRSILLSSENFCFLDPDYTDNMAEIIKGDWQVKIIFYVRHQIQLLESIYLQFQKVGDDYKGKIENFFLQLRNEFDFNKIIAPWVNNFGEEAIIARLFDKRIIGEDVKADFLKILGIGDVIEVRNMEKLNLSLLPEYSKLVTLIDEITPKIQGRQAIIEELLLLSRKFKKSSDFSLINDDLKRDISEYYANSNHRFAERFLDEHQSSLFLSDLEN